MMRTVALFAFAFFGVASAGPCDADVDNNGAVDVEDLLQTLGAYGISQHADTDNDGDTDIEDLLRVLAEYGNVCDCGENCGDLPVHAYALVGNPDAACAQPGGNANGWECPTFDCSPSFTAHEVRCCSDVQLPGYTQRNGCAIWAESQFLSVGEPGGGADGPGCVHEANLATAAATCAGDGSRMCYVSELSSGCTQGTGCGHDSDLVWTAEECTPVAAPYTTVVVGNPDAACAQPGGNANGWECPTEGCAASNEAHEVRCCSDVQLPGYQQKNGCDVWAESQFLSVGEPGGGPDGPGCVHEANAQLAINTCVGDGARMCTPAEILGGEAGGCTTGTGCGHDTDLVWTDEDCTPSVPVYATVKIGNPGHNCVEAGTCPTEECAASIDLHEVRCCSDMQLPGYQQKNGCSVWAESQFLSIGPAGQGEDGWNDAPGCVHSATLEEGFDVCIGDGARMCTAEEIDGSCTQGTGCGHDGDLVWTGEECTAAPVDPAPEPEVVLGDYAVVILGNEDALAWTTAGAMACAAATEAHEVRCCSDVELAGYQQRNGCSVWAESQFLSVGVEDAGCVHEATLSEANAVCNGDGARLCTQSEVENGCTMWTGCEHDSDLVWTSQGCDPNGGQFGYECGTDTCPENDLTVCHAEEASITVMAAGHSWEKSSHMRHTGMGAAVKVYPDGFDSWQTVGCEEECACMCASTDTCVEFDYRNANQLCRMTNTATAYTDVPCEFNQHLWIMLDPTPPPPPIPSLMLQGILDLTVPGGGFAGKGIELTAISDITAEEMSQFSIGVANNGGGTDGIETDPLPAVALGAGDSFYLIRNAEVYEAYFGGGVFTTENEGVTYMIDDSISQNGDDAIELFYGATGSEVVVDIFGDINVDGTGEAWEYKDSWAYRNGGATPSAIFDITEWNIAGAECSDDSTTNCDSSCGPYPDFACPEPEPEPVPVPVYASARIGNPEAACAQPGGNANGWECPTESCDSGNTLHEVRCCSDTELPGYQQKNGCAVFAESQFLSVGPAGGGPTGPGCVHEASLATAMDTCANDGARMCTAEEIEGTCTAGTGCGHDTDMIWTGDACEPTPLPYAFAKIGNPEAACITGNANGWFCPSTKCAASNEPHEVRCCSDIELPGYQQKNGCDVWAESQFLSVGEPGGGPDGPGCVHEAIYADALATCVGDGARMCTAEEIEGTCTQGTGCGHDTDLIWTGTSCNPWVPDFGKLRIGNPGHNCVEAGTCPAEECAAATDQHEVRCCSDHQLPGYQQKNGCDVWAESQFLSVGEPGGGPDGPGCVHNAGLNAAFETCIADGARMCTVAELEGSCTAGTGCGHDEDLIWTGNACSQWQTQCAIQTDVAVALAFCESTDAVDGVVEAATPTASVYALCMAETSDAEALQAICVVEGVAQTAHIICSGLGYGSGTCDDVAQMALDTFVEGVDTMDAGVCAAVAAGASGLCPVVLGLVVETTCDEWAAADGPGLSFATSALIALGNAIPDAITPSEWCASLPENEGVNPPMAQVATLTACMSVPEADMMSACETLGPSPAIHLLCMDLGFGSGNCDDAVAMFESDADVQAALATYGCAAFPTLQPGFCGLAQTLTDAAETCEDWITGPGYVGASVDMDAFNAALGVMQVNELAVLAPACASVGDIEGCDGHSMGHICAQLVDAGVIEAPPSCVTSVEGDACFGHVDWAMNTGVVGNPEWYPGLNADSSFEAFQCSLVYNDNVPDCTVVPCGIECTPEYAECGLEDACAGHVDWAMNNGIHSNPEWYPGLSPESDWDHFQCELALSPNVPDCNMMPCNEPCDGEYGEPALEDGVCQTAIENAGEDDDCFGHVMWAMNTGIVTNPEWYPDLTAESSFEDFQCHLYGLTWIEHCTTMPCEHTCVVNEVPHCHDVIAGDACFGHVVWAMETGIVTNPEWYPGLDAGSPFAAFQCELTLSVNVADCVDAPCDFDCDGEYLTGAGGDGVNNGWDNECGAIEADCQGHIDWAMATGINTNPEWYGGLTPDSPMEAFQCQLVVDPNRPECLAPPCDTDCSGFYATCSTATEGDACFGHVDWAMNTGIITNPEWYPGLTSDSTFEAFQCELALSEGVPDCVFAPCDFVCDGEDQDAAGGDGVCVTSVEGDACFGHVDWAMNTGVVGNPEWYPGLSAESSFEQFQCSLVYNDNVPDCTVVPCGMTCLDPNGVPPPLSFVASCGKPILGNGNPNPACLPDLCEPAAAQHEVRCCSDTELPGYQQTNGCDVWAESQFLSVGEPGGGADGPGCVHDSPFAVAAATCAGDGARLCTASELEASCTAGTGCAHDSDLIWSGSECTPAPSCGIEDACVGHVEWAMNTGIVTNPEWYPNLDTGSPFEAFQCELALSENVPDCNMMACDFACDGDYLTGAGGDGIDGGSDAECGEIEADCQGHIDWAMETGINTNPEWYGGLHSWSPMEAFQCQLVADPNRPECLAPPCDTDCSEFYYECSTASAGDACFGHVDWAMNTGIITNPEWYPNLEVGSSFEAFQCELSLSEGVPDCTAMPCGVSCDGVYESPAGGDGAGGDNDDCGPITEACQGHIDWAMATGINTNPEWYGGLTPDSPMEAFQCQLNVDVNVPDCTAPPCDVDCSSFYATCSTATEGDACFGHVAWAMNTGIVTNPEWYPNLDTGSSFEAFQCELALSDGVPDCVFAPCDFACDGDYLTGAGGDGFECATSVEGDACFGHITWAMNTGINTNPEWYPNVNADSSFEAFQCQLIFDPYHVELGDCVNFPCGVECVEGSVAVAECGIEDACVGHVEWAMNTGIVTNPEWYPNLDTGSSFEAFQCELALSVNVPDCNVAPCDFVCDGDYLTGAGGDGNSDAGDAECNVPSDECQGHLNWAMETGINTNPEWYGDLPDMIANAGVNGDTASMFQCQLFLDPNQPSCDGPPCDFDCTGADYSCSTAAEGDSCFGHVVWAMGTGIVTNPEWYPGLSTASTFEEFQCELALSDGVPDCSALPCNVLCDGEYTQVPETPPPSPPVMIIKGLGDLNVGGMVGDYAGNSGKFVQLKALTDVATMNEFALGIATNGNAQENVEIDALPGGIPLAAGDSFWLIRNAAAMAEYFPQAAEFFDATHDATWIDGARACQTNGVSCNYMIAGAIGINGDDVIELFYHGGGFDGTNQYTANQDECVDAFGVLGEDGSNTAWEYMDAWAYRMNESPNSGVFGPCGEPNNSGFFPAEGSCPGWKIADKDCSDNSSSNCEDGDSNHWQRCNQANNANAAMGYPEYTCA